MLAGGYKWTEAPVSIKDSGCLLFSNIPNNINNWKDGGHSFILTPLDHTRREKKEMGLGSIGILMDAKGKAVVYQRGRQLHGKDDVAVK